MTWGARAGRATVLSVLAVVWAVAAHRLALPADGHLHHPGAGALAPALAWATGTSALLAWWLAPVGRGDRGRRAFAVGAALSAGQVLTHAALALAPLLGAQTRTTVPALAGAPHHGAHLHGGTVSGGVTLDAALGALAHGGLTMTGAHVVATVAAALVWALLGTLTRSVRGWWALPAPAPLTLATTRRASAWLLALRAPRSLVTFSWDGRGPPCPAV